MYMFHLMYVTCGLFYVWFGLVGWLVWVSLQRCSTEGFYFLTLVGLVVSRPDVLSSNVP